MTDSVTALFSQKHVAQLTGVEAVTLQNWVKRGIIRPTVGGEGKGSARLYDLAAVVKIYLIGRFSGLGLDPSLGMTLADKAAPVADMVIAQRASEDPRSWLPTSEGGPLDREYHIWLIDPRRLAYTGEVRMVLKCDRAGRPVISDQQARHLPLEAIWFKVDIHINSIVMDALAWQHDGFKPAYLDWLMLQAEALADTDSDAPTPEPRP